MDEKGTDPVLFSPTFTGNWLVAAAEDYLRAHSGDKFSLRGVSEALHVNGSYLLRVYKAHTGRTLLWYHTFLRCEKAQDLLRKSGMSISEIGEAVGFVTSAHFSHVFKKMTGMTPSSYRHEQQRENGECEALAK